MYKLITICLGTDCAQELKKCVLLALHTVLKLYTLYLSTANVYTVVVLHCTVMLSYYNYPDPCHPMNNPIIILTMLQYSNCIHMKYIIIHILVHRYIYAAHTQLRTVVSSTG